MTDNSHKLAFLNMLRAFVETVKEAGPHGAPAGVMYAAVMDKMNLAQFEQVMGALVAASKVRKQGHLYFHVSDL